MYLHSWICAPSESSNLKPNLRQARCDGKFVFPLSGVVPFNIFCAPLLSTFPRSLLFLPSFSPSESRVAATLAATYEANKSHCEGTNERRNGEERKNEMAMGSGAWHGTGLG